MGKKGIPILDLGRCTDCGSCIEVCPEVFRRNPDTGLIEVLEPMQCPEEGIREAIKVCPADCIETEEVES